jgi:predicted phage terminase large subunit-like protein
LIPNISKRKIVTVPTGPNGEDRRIVLPYKWSVPQRKDYQNFSLLSPAEKRHVTLAISSFAYFHHRVFLPYYCDSEGKKWPEKLWPHLVELCNDYQRALHKNLLPFDVFPEEDSPFWRICRVLPNRMLKTATTCYSLPLWLLGINNETRILIATANEDLGSRYISVVKNNIEKNPFYKEVFGELHRGKGHVWAADKIEVFGRKRSADASMEIRGWESAVEGIGCDVAIADDVQNFENSRTEMRRAKQWEWLTEPFLRRLDTETRTLIVDQTRHEDDDFAGRIQDLAKDGHSWDFKARPAIDPAEIWPPKLEDFIIQDERHPDFWTVGNLKDPDFWESRLLCPDILSLQTLLEEWAPVKERAAFYKTRLNMVRDESSSWFDAKTLKDCARADGMMNVHGEIKPKISVWDVNVGLPPNGSRWMEELEMAGLHIDRRVVSIDTAASTPLPGTDPDYTVIQLWGMDKTCGVRIMLDMVRFRTSSPSVFKERLKKFLDAYEPNFTIFEENGMARWIGRDLQKELGWPITPFFKKDEIDIEEFKALIESGLLFYAWGDARSAEKMLPFEQELLHYPRGAHDDTLTCAAQAQMKLKPKSMGNVELLNTRIRQSVQQGNDAELVSAVSQATAIQKVIDACLTQLAPSM